MNDKKNITKTDDYSETKFNHLQRSQTTSKLTTDFKLERIYPRNINIGLDLDNKENPNNYEQTYNGKNSYHFKTLNIDHKMYHEYLTLKDHQVKKTYRRNKISQIFNIRSINLIEKGKPKEEKQEKLDIEKPKITPNSYSNLLKKTRTEKEKQQFHLVIGEKKQPSPDRSHLKIMTEKRNSSSFKKFIQNKSMPIQKSGDNFEHKLQEYLAYIRQNCQLHGISMKEIENYSRHQITCYVGKGNNGRLVRQTLKKRWWWTIIEEKKKSCNLIWTQLKEKSYYMNNPSTNFQTLKKSPEKGSRKSLSPNNGDSLYKEAAEKYELEEVYLHNHFENNEYLGNKKALFYNMKKYYEKQKKNVFDYLPVTFHVRHFGDQAWQEFTNYFEEDLKKNPGERRLWIVKPGQNSNRGNGITIHSEISKIKDLVSAESSEEADKKRTFIIQKYIDKPFLYHKRKFDIRCYMLLVRLNESVKGYWYSEGYIRTSCFEYQLEDTVNQFIHLTNDAIQVNSDKYGKYEDGNKLSYNNFQKYLDTAYKTCNYRFIQNICPQLKQIATESIEATYQILRNCQGKHPIFEVFGLDFMIDDKFKPWLIEINTNPCLQVSSTTLERVIPRMLDNAFKLSVDVLFPPPLCWPNSKKHNLSNKISSNLFELIFDDSKISVSSEVKDEILMDLGQIQENSEVFEQKQEKEVCCGDLTDSIEENGSRVRRN